MAAWGKIGVERSLDKEELTKRLKQISPSSEHVIISVTQDDYSRVVGGIQLCVQFEEREFVSDGYLYLNLHPHSPLPCLSPETDANSYFFDIVANGQALGTASAATLGNVLKDVKAEGMRMSCIVHSLLGHSPEILANLLHSADIDRALFWVHDNFSICPNYTLLRNDITFCHAPPVGSPACGICVYGKERSRHLRRLERLFNDEILFDIAAPSPYALSLWTEKSSLRHGDKKIIPHVTLSPRKTAPQTSRSLPPDSPIRVAFLGYPVFHKGWPAFLEIASRMANNGRYEFFHIGQEKTKNKHIRFIKARTSSSRPDAMTRAIVDNAIDVVLLWVMMPETFSFTLFESLAADAFIVTNGISGNIQAVVKERDAGLVCENEDELIRLFEGGELERIIRQRRARGRRLFAMNFSAFSRQAMD